MDCERCFNSVNGIHTVSMFNTDTICMSCKRRERQHPDYEAARKAESDAVKMGDMNFPGIGCPKDLQC